jgi:oligoendopeptidase F
MNKKRSDIPQRYKWDISKIFSSIKEWENAFLEIKPESEKNKWNEILSYKGKLKDSAQILAICLENYFDIYRKIEKLFTYAHLYLDENLANDEAKHVYGLISNLYSDFLTHVSWIEPEILSIDTNLLKKYLKDNVMHDFVFYVEKLIKLKPHTLSEEQEKILARSTQSLNVCNLVFSSFNNADIKFDKIQDKDKKLYPLSHASYLVYLKSHDRILRQNAFEKIHEKYYEYENTLTELLYGEIKNACFISNSRNYDSALKASLFPNNIDIEVYLNLIQTVRDNISSLHNYVSLKKEKLKLDKVHLYDLYVSITKEVDFEFSYDEATNLVIESTSCLGKDYQQALKKGILESRWIDVYETENKRSGGYSSGCYDSNPYILLNYENSLNDVLTLAHECGHSMHSLLANQTQKYWYSKYPIFLAEIASTLNEQLCLDFLIKKIKNEEEKIYLFGNMLDRINATLFRQTLFAEFELEIHKLQKENIPLTPSLLKDKYRELYNYYYGKDFFVDDLLVIEWARIPHFYSPFYVYQYAIGISVALSIFNKIKKDESYKDKYLNLLKSGGRDYPLNILKQADIDLRRPICIKDAIKVFDEIIKKIKF